MGFLNKLKNKLFPEEKEILYYENNSAKKENRFINESLLENNIVKFTPKSFADTQQISDTLKKGNTVVVDISELDKSEALRMIDFLGGVMYALNGDMKRINKTVFEFSTPK